MNKRRGKYYRLNYQITSPRLRLLSETGEQIGIVSKIDALQRAKEFDVDVVEIAPNADPPVAKLIDFKKFKYQEAKKEREQKKTQKSGEIKEIRLRPFIGEHDFNNRVKRANEFLADNNQVRLKLLFRGRELRKKEFGFDVVNRFVASLSGIKLVREPKMLGKTIVATIAPMKKDKEEPYAQTQDKKDRNKTL